MINNSVLGYKYNYNPNDIKAKIGMSLMSNVNKKEYSSVSTQTYTLPVHGTDTATAI